ncbi:Biotin-protein ligase [Serinicoccus hydrothermalis]|uniref:Biotin-protein ligase n=1 Tax=Serinicoccus hydrothermalis TaxID=1758689 RepID=A0A1B1NAQ0_9MICO|nr:biotin--[acetyl-CoA-carboxylase] ligase [Serinicoccus hydrothermalis]ANS78445.1 Biotin-protein ligase [Serinicoccus hydrothermalis]
MTSLRWAAPERHESLPSTNLAALADPRPGRVVVADHQSAGLGRRGRSWTSPPGAALAVSAVLPPLPADLAGWLPLAAGVAVVDALASSRWPVEARLKWPNDALVPAGPAPGKISGVLTQVADGGALVVGTGLNVDHDRSRLPVPTATSWRLVRGGSPLPPGAREGFLEDYLGRLRELHAALVEGDVDRVHRAYEARCATLGRDVVLHRPGGGRVRGRAVRVDARGALVLATSPTAGVESVHDAGDVEHLRDQ